METMYGSNPGNQASLTKGPVKASPRHGMLRELSLHRGLYLMMLPGILYILVMYYFPMAGSVIAFQQYNPRKGLFGSEWIGWKNFEFLFRSKSVWNVTWNTISYNLLFMVLGLGLAMLVAVLLQETGHKRLSGLYKSVMLFPYLLSWVVIGYLLFALLNMDRGILNRLLLALGHEPVMWYSEPAIWRFLLVGAYLWKNVGYLCVLYVAGIMNISPEYYEAAQMDGATKVQQILRITVPMLLPITITLFLLQAGKIFYAAFGDWGLFYNLPKESGVLFGTTDVIDTYVYRALRQLNDFGMSSAVGLYQSLVGFLLVLASNLVVRKYDRESAMF